MKKKMVEIPRVNVDGDLAEIKKKDAVRIFIKLMIEIIFSVRTSDTSKCK